MTCPEVQAMISDKVDEMFTTPQVFFNIVYIVHVVLYIINTFEVLFDT